MRSLIFTLLLGTAFLVLCSGQQTSVVSGNEHSGDRSGTSGDRSGISRSGTSGDHSGKSTDRSGNSGDHSGNGHSSHSADRSGNAHSGNSGSRNFRSGSHHYGSGSGKQWRQVQMNIQDKGVSLNSVANEQGKKGNTNKLEFHLAAEGSSQLRFRAKYFFDQGDSQAKMNFRVSFESLLEFRELGSPFDGFTEGVDTLVQEIVFKGDRWSFAQIEDQTDEDGTVVSGFKATYTESGGELFQMVCRVSASEYSVGDHHLSPDSMKIDILIPKFQYKQNGTYLAVLAKVQSAYSFAFQGQSVSAENKGAQAFLNWEDKVTINGVGATVMASPFKECDAAPDTEGDPKEQATRVYFSFNAKNPSNIVWDPTLGLSAASPLQVSLALFFFVALFLTIFF